MIYFCFGEFTNNCESRKYNIKMHTSDRKTVNRNSGYLSVKRSITTNNFYPNNKMNITVFSFDNKETACAHLRLISPISKLKNQVNLTWANDYIHSENHNILASIMHSDLIIIQRFFPNKNTDALIEILSKTKIPIIYETDDLLLDIPKYNQHQKISSQIRAFLLKTISLSTAITVSTPRLKEYYSKYHSNVHVLPNLLDAKIWLPFSKKKRKDTITIGYAGTPDHTNDLMLLDKILPIIFKKFGTSVNFHFLGCKTELLSKLPNFKFTPLQPNYASYATTLINSDIDIGLAPLHDNQFNCCKSNIKWLEYSICGIAGIYSDLAPYNPYVEHRKTGLLVENNDFDSWIENIALLIDNPKLRISIAAQAKEKVLSNYLCDKKYNIYHETWTNTSILKQKI